MEARRRCNIVIDATCSCPWRPVRWRSQRPPLPHSLAPPPPSAASAALRLGRHPRAMNPPPPAAQLRPTPCSSDAWRIAPGRPLACFFAVTCDSSEALHAPRDTGCSVVHDVVEWLRSLSPRPNRGPLPALDIGPMRFNSVYSVMGRVTTGGRPPRRRARGGKHAAPRHDCPGRPRPGRGGAPDTRHRCSDTGARRPEDTLSVPGQTPPVCDGFEDPVFAHGCIKRTSLFDTH